MTSSYTVQIMQLGNLFKQTSLKAFLLYAEANKFRLHTCVDEAQGVKY